MDPWQHLWIKCPDRDLNEGQQDVLSGTSCFFCKHLHVHHKYFSKGAIVILYLVNCVITIKLNLEII